jgi:putative methyltransferase (TIGR04325 family)
MLARQIAKLLLPPIIPALFARLQPAERSFLGTYWPARAQEKWDEDSQADVARSNWPTIAARVDGTGPLNMLPYLSNEQDLTAHNMLMTFLYALARAARHKDSISVLDWGGGAGHYALVARRMLPDVTLDYVVKELPALCRTGQELNPNVTFASSDEECFGRSYDFVLANNAVQYAEDWKAKVTQLAIATDRWLMINCIPAVRRVPGYVVVQRLRRAGFGGEFVSHVVNRDELIDQVLAQKLVLVRELMAWGTVRYRGAPEDTTGVGFLFERPRPARVLSHA